jgi:hypothetical protein
MHQGLRATLGSLVFAIVLMALTAVETRPHDVEGETQHGLLVQSAIPQEARDGALPFVRTELFFGTARPGRRVTGKEFRKFVDLEVRPRFPEGLTLLEAKGQFQRDDITVKEHSFVLILLYPYESSNSYSDSIQRIRDLYKAQFDQESVLRVDDRDIVWVSF